MKSIFQQLQALGVGEFVHLHGSLEMHLRGTYDLLTEWGANTALCEAGLYHAAYSTAGFEGALASHEQRDRVIDIIGEQAEQIVYMYCACDRDVVFSRIGKQQPVFFKDRFTQEEYELSVEQWKQFCELTVANELEISRNSEQFVEQYGGELKELFGRMDRYLSVAAKLATEKTL
ncbi:hypothetical protein A9Q99_08030 [Gammaproteobacteria bacterium 45_16_T64]|nr:hypothetical protein A9Q99_08030 [Gammaproteobacteria bacterium 45_16_T64]